MQTLILPLDRYELLHALKIAMLYLLLAVLSIELFRVGSGIAVVWLANAAAIACLSQLPYRRWWLILLLLAFCLLLANGLMGSPLAFSVLFLPGNLLEILAGAFFLRHFWRDSDVFYTLRRVLFFIWYGVVLPVLLGALVSALIFVWHGGLPASAVFLHWLEGSIIGGVSVLPAAYWVYRNGWGGFSKLLADRLLPASLALAVAVALSVPLLLPFPFVYISLPLFLIAYQSGVGGTVIANMLVALSICILIALGLLLPPPTIYSWGYALFYLPVLATLIPPLLLAVAMEMNRSASIALELSERRYRTLYQQTPAMMYSCDESGRILTVNDVWLKSMGYSQLEVLGRFASDFLDPHYQSAPWDDFLRNIQLEGSCQNLRQRLLNKHGIAIDVLSSAALEVDRMSRVARYLVVQLDITDRVRTQHLAYHDPLTQLPNRLLFSDRLSQACQQCQRSGGAFAIAFIDLDFFKEVNDQFGHETGDALLIEVAHRLQSAVRSSDTVSRLAGDEFVLLLGNLAPGREADVIAAKIRDTLAAPYLLNTHSIAISASIGLAFYPQNGVDEADLMRSADEAMYQAKHAGRNCFVTAKT